MNGGLLACRECNGFDAMELWPGTYKDTIAVQGPPFWWGHPDKSTSHSTTFTCLSSNPLLEYKGK